MISEYLLEDIDPYLEKSEEIWIAVALVNEEGFNKIQFSLKHNPPQHYIIGIDLPTTPSVLRKIQASLSPSSSAAIYNSKSKVFHPKVYIIKTDEGLVAFIASANLTNGGLANNVELGYRVTNASESEKLLEWFKNLYPDTYPLTDYNIDEYEKKFKIVKPAIDQAKLTKATLILKRDVAADPLAGIDFSDRYFKREHHYAFRPELWEEDSLEANKERGEVTTRLLELHDTIFPSFRDSGLGELQPNVKIHIVSMDHHFPGRTQQKLNAMWLSYGKSQTEVERYHDVMKTLYMDKEDDFQTFINHARVQVKIQLKEIGIWLMFAKNHNGSLFDRQYFRNKMSSSDEQETFYRMVTQLPGEYWIEVYDRKEYLSSFDAPSSLWEFCRRDRATGYFIIGRDYKISDPAMSEEQLPQEVIKEFKRLYPLYEYMRDKQFKRV